MLFFPAVINWTHWRPIKSQIGHYTALHHFCLRSVRIKPDVCEHERFAKENEIADVVDKVLLCILLLTVNTASFLSVKQLKFWFDRSEKKKPNKTSGYSAKRQNLLPCNVTGTFSLAVRPLNCSTLPPASPLYQHSCLWDHSNATSPAPEGREVIFSGISCRSAVHHVVHRLTGVMCASSKGRGIA